MTFKDHFSSLAQQYSRSRPDYPEALYEWLARQCRERSLAWDCGTGNGQAARGLGDYFKLVVASDASYSQITAASASANTVLVVARAEQPPLTAASVDLVTVAQALHWFDIPAFFASAGVVLKPAGVLAVWCYGLCRIEPEIDSVVYSCYQRQLADYWPPERRLVEEKYATIDLPFEPLKSPEFIMEKSWTREQLLGYLNSWSATQRYREQQQKNPLVAVEDELSRLWPDVTPRTVQWPVTLLAAKKQ